MADILKVNPKGAKPSEDRWREFEAKYLSEPAPRVPPKPKPNLAVTAELGPKARAAAKVDPASVELRSLTREPDGTVVVERARPTELIEVLEVDREGRPALARRIDCETGERSMVEYEDGYRPQAGAVSDYNPLDALKRD